MRRAESIEREVTRVRGGKTALAVVAFETAMILALAGSYASAQTMGEYGATMGSTGVATEQQGGSSGELAGAPSVQSPLDRPSALDAGNDPLSESPSYLDSGNGSGSMLGNEGGPPEDSNGIQYAPSVP
jgi:hypothetical protein